MIPGCLDLKDCKDFCRQKYHGRELEEMLFCERQVEMKFPFRQWRQAMQLTWQGLMATVFGTEKNLGPYVAEHPLVGETTEADFFPSHTL